MLQIDVVRGKDSTGVAAVSSQGVVQVAKEAWLPTDFLESRGAKKMFERTTHRCLIGHNRAATVGAVNKAGAHPFEFDNIVGVHNGTTGKHLFDGHSDFDVDSEALYNHANNKGIEDAWSCLNGAAALAYYDKVDKSLNLLRNDQRPMTLAFSEDGKTMFFASEWWMIVAACEKAGIKIGKVKNTAVNELYKFEVGSYGDSMETFTTKKIAPYKKVTPSKTSALMGKNSGEEVNTGDIVEFEFVSFALPQKTYSNYVAEVQTVNTKKPHKGRVYLDLLDKSTNDEYKASMDNTTYRGKVVSVIRTGLTTTFSINRNSIEEVLEEDEVDAILFEDNLKVYTRDEFNAGSGVNNCCSWCGDPVSFDLLDFKGAGSLGGMQEVICEECQDLYKEDIQTYTDIQEVFKYEGN